MKHEQTFLLSGLSRVAGALADPAREAMVAALADGTTRPAGELASIAGVSPQSASAHLQKLVEAKVLAVWTQGRFRYYHIADDDADTAIENLANLAAKSRVDRLGNNKHLSELRQIRSCYHHLAGQLGVAMGKILVQRRYVRMEGRTGIVTDAGLAWCRQEGIAFSRNQAASVRLCVDWTERVPHLAGTFPTAVFQWLIERNCLHEGDVPRALRLTFRGREFMRRLGVL